MLRSTGNVRFFLPRASFETTGQGGQAMAMECATVYAGNGPFELEAVVVVTPRGITVTACSPNYAHLGATAQAVPRPEHDRTATVSILAVPCHRDEVPAHDIAAALATRFRVTTAASCGFHVDNASKDDIQTFLDTTQELIAKISEYVEQVLPRLQRQE